MAANQRRPRWGLFLGLGALLLIGGWAAVSYNRLVALEQNVQSQWAQVQSVYQRRLDLIPNLVATVKGAAAFEQETLIAVVEARAKIGRVSSEELLNNPDAFTQMQRSQDQLSGALSRLLVVAEQYPQLRATENFRDLQVQLEGTENRIAVERMRFNESARDFNTARARFPTNLLVGVLGKRFAEKAYFTAPQEAASAPQIAF